MNDYVSQMMRRAIESIDNMTIDELEQELKSFGIDVVRKSTKDKLIQEVIESYKQNEITAEVSMIVIESLVNKSPEVNDEDLKWAYHALLETLIQDNDKFQQIVKDLSYTSTQLIHLMNIPDREEKTTYKGLIKQIYALVNPTGFVYTYGFRNGIGEYYAYAITNPIFESNPLASN